MAITYAKELRKGDWDSGKVKKLQAFSIEIRPQGLIGSDHAEVVFFYETTNDEQNNNRHKRLVIFGKQDAVFSKSMLTIDRKKNEKEKHEMLDQFQSCWKLAKLQGRSYGWLGKKPQQGKPEFLNKETNHTTYYKPDAFGFSEPSNLLYQRINNLGMDVKTFGNKIGKTSSLYSHTSGAREISRDTAIEYAAKLNCDPVDLMFNKRSVPVWAKADTLKTVETDTYYRPCELYTYYTDSAEMTVVPRDIYRPDIKAIQIKSVGSMFDNQVCFYYHSNDTEKNNLNKLCVVGTEIEDPITADKETRYFFGLYEESRGKANLINPDPFIDDYELKYVLKNFQPTFVAPIVAMVNPREIVDQTELKKTLPAEKLVREEEVLRAELEFVRRQLRDEREKNEVTAKQTEKVAVEIKNLNSRIKDVMDQIADATKNKSDLSNLFQKETEILDKIKKFKVIKNKRA